MATLDDLPELIRKNPQIRDDFLKTLAAFCQRHGIPAKPEDFVGLGVSGPADTAGFAAGARTVKSPKPVFLYRDGPNYSRFIDSG